MALTVSSPSSYSYWFNRSSHSYRDCNCCTVIFLPIFTSLISASLSLVRPPENSLAFSNYRNWSVLVWSSSPSIAVRMVSSILTNLFHTSSTFFAQLLYAPFIKFTALFNVIRFRICRTSFPRLYLVQFHSSRVCLAMRTNQVFIIWTGVYCICLILIYFLFYCVFALLLPYSQYCLLISASKLHMHVSSFPVHSHVRFLHG